MLETCTHVHVLLQYSGRAEVYTLQLYTLEVCVWPCVSRRVCAGLMFSVLSAVRERLRERSVDPCIAPATPHFRPTFRARTGSIYVSPRSSPTPTPTGQLPPRSRMLRLRVRLHAPSLSTNSRPRPASYLAAAGSHLGRDRCSALGGPLRRRPLDACAAHSMPSPRAPLVHAIHAGRAHVQSTPCVDAGFASRRDVAEMHARRCMRRDAYTHTDTTRARPCLRRLGLLEARHGERGDACGHGRRDEHGHLRDGLH